jgi:hypothetical protein
MRPNKALQRTPLRGPKIVAILARDFRSIVVPIYECGAAERRSVGRLGNLVG